MTVNLIGAIAKILALVPTGIPRQNREAVACIWLFGFIRGYSLRNIQNLIRQFNNEMNYGKFWKFIEHNATFGMNVPSWSNYAKPIPNGGATAGYASIAESVFDRLDWDRRRGISGTVDNYLVAVQAAAYNMSTAYPEVVAKYSAEPTTLAVQIGLLPAVVLGVLGITSRL